MGYAGGFSSFSISIFSLTLRADAGFCLHFGTLPFLWSSSISRFIIWKDEDGILRNFLIVLSWFGYLFRSASSSRVWSFVYRLFLFLSNMVRFFISLNNLYFSETEISLLSISGELSKIIRSSSNFLARLDSFILLINKVLSFSDSSISWSEVSDLNSSLIHTCLGFQLFIREIHSLFLLRLCSPFQYFHSPRGLWSRRPILNK